MNSITGTTLTYNWVCAEIAKKSLEIIGGISLLGLAVVGTIFLQLRSQNPQSNNQKKPSIAKKNDELNQKFDLKNKIIEMLEGNIINLDRMCRQMLEENIINLDRMCRCDNYEFSSIDSAVKPS